MRKNFHLLILMLILIFISVACALYCSLINTNATNNTFASQPTPETSIFGPPEASKEQVIAFIRLRNHFLHLNCYLENLVDFYYEEAALEGIRPDIAIAQAILETGYFRFKRSVVIPAQNNYAGIGAINGTVKGFWFDSPRLGVRAHIQHLLAYATHRRPVTPVVDERLSKTRCNGKCHSWESLNGKWAVPGHNYGETILQILAGMKQL